MKLYEIIIICILAIVLALLFYVMYRRWGARVPKLETSNTWEERAIQREEALKPLVLNSVDAVVNEIVVKADERLKVAQENKLAFEETKTLPAEPPKRSVAEIYAEMQAKSALEAETRKIKSAVLAAQRKAQNDIELARIQSEAAEASKNSLLADQRYKDALEVAGAVKPYDPLAEIEATINRASAPYLSRIAILKKELKQDGLVFQGGK